MASSAENIPQTSYDGFENFDHYVPVSKYGRHKDENGRWVSNNPELPTNSKKFGEGRGHYVVEVKEKFNKERRPEAGDYIDHLLNEKFIMQGDGENISIVNSFEEMDLNPKLMNNISKKGYSKPLPIQRATFSLIRNNYDVIGHAETGGGKTAAFLIPIINYILREKGRAGYVKNTHPYCIVISPTKELAEQLYDDAEEFADGLNCKAVLSFGEIPRSANVADIKKGCDILICTVGRLCDYLAAENLKLSMLRFLVFDEADKLFGVQSFYEDLVENLLPKCRMLPNVQKLLFSATDCADLAKLKEDFLSPSATKVVVGCLNTVNRFVIQRVMKVEVDEKREKLLELMEDMYLKQDSEPPPKTIIFVNSKRLSTVIACYLSLKGYKAYPMHGNLTAVLRREAIEALQRGICHILVSTDVTARGLDIKNISHVINYEMPRRDTWASYVHRVGRTGRVGNVGLATTFFSPSIDNGMALILYRWLEINDQHIPAFLAEEAQRQADTEDLQMKAKEEYEKAFDESYCGNSDEEGDS